MILSGTDGWNCSISWPDSECWPRRFRRSAGWLATDASDQRRERGRGNRTSWFRGTVPCSGFDNQGSDPASPSWSRASRRQLFRGCRYPRHRRLGDPPTPDDRNRSGNQATFESEQDTDEPDSPYLLIQRQFEDPDDNWCYIETHDEKYCGHFQLRHVDLTTAESDDRARSSEGQSYQRDLCNGGHGVRESITGGKDH